MVVLRLAPIFLALGLDCVFSEMRPLSPVDKKKLMNSVGKWGAPPIDVFIDGRVTVMKKWGTMTYVFDYKNTGEGKKCHVLFTRYLKKLKRHSKRKWYCNKAGTDQEGQLHSEDSEYSGND